MDFDSHITDSQFEIVDELYICPKCDHRFEVKVQYEFGTGTPLTEDGTVKCTDCGREIE
jgi:DNA-directed RNA polymerase subunit RPC12/RpoP